MQQTKLPAILKANELFYQNYFSDLTHPLKKALHQLIISSDFACRHTNLLANLLDEDDCQKPLFFNNYVYLLKPIVKDNAHLARNLRQFRHRHFFRLLLREIAGLASTEETMRAWSDCADALILATLNYCEQELELRYGKALDINGVPIKLQVLAMGKLGGQELNFSSDIDLIFCSSSVGYTNGLEKITTQQFYQKVIQRFVQLLQQVTADGFVFRVDLRLRPYGDSGPLVCTLAMIENYYQEQGRDWERYAMVKARLIGERLTANHWFYRLITPFVYRRYIDFSVLESLRTMKGMIEREVQLNPRLDDIKRGKGGIREIEFIVQNAQLIRGGRNPLLRQHSTLSALAKLQQENLLAHSHVLKEAYLFLRKLENCLQSQNDQQIHSLPQDPIKQAQLLLIMGFIDWQKFLEKLTQYQRIIHLFFRRVARKEFYRKDHKRLLDNQFAHVWQGHIESTMAINLFSSLGFKNAEQCYQMLYTFRHSRGCRRLSQASRLLLDNFMVLLLGELIVIDETDTVLLQVIRLLENIVGRSTYIALLTENPTIIKDLLHWFTVSPFLTNLLVNQPFLLEFLLDPPASKKLPSRNKMNQYLTNKLASCAENELEQETLRQFKLNCWFFAACAELNESINAVEVSRYLSDVTEVIIEKVLMLACQKLSKRYPQIMAVKAHFYIIAYGKLGGREMNYNSDLDLVFVHNVAHAEETLITRLSQKILHMLTTRSQSGILFNVDTRLRPSGAAGLLVSHLDTFIDYQCQQAWTWEHQALLRARILGANKFVKQIFKQLKTDILFLPRHVDSLRYDVLTMREKINRYLDPNQVKYAKGGLIDLEFLIQFIVLANPRLNFVNQSNMFCFLQKIAKEKLLSKSQFTQLKQAYLHYHRLLHLNILRPGLRECLAERKAVFAISELIYQC